MGELKKYKILFVLKPTRVTPHNTFFSKFLTTILQTFKHSFIVVIGGTNK